MRTRSVSPLRANRQCEALGQSPEAKRNQSHPLRHFIQVQGTRGQGDTVTWGRYKRPDAVVPLQNQIEGDTGRVRCTRVGKVTRGHGEMRGWTLIVMLTR